MVASDFATIKFLLFASPDVCSIRRKRSCESIKIQASGAVCWLALYERDKFFQKNYWYATRQMGVGSLLVLPLWTIYQAGVFLFSHSGLHARTGLDDLLTRSCTTWSLPAYSSTLLVFGIFVLLLVFPANREALSRVRAVYFPYMLLESIIYAAVFGIAVGGVTEFLLSVGEHVETVKLATLVSHLGAGIYEELFFRVILFAGLARAARKIRGSGPRLRYGTASVISSLLFAGFHYWFWFGEAFGVHTFLFRFLAGVALCALFMLRGFGITVYTHALYNVFLMFR